MLRSSLDLESLRRVKPDIILTTVTAFGVLDTRNRIVELTRHAIRSWRRLAGLANPGEASPRQADQPDRAAGDRAQLTYPAHRSVGPVTASVRIADASAEDRHKDVLWVHKIGASTEAPLGGELSKA